MARRQPKPHNVLFAFTDKAKELDKLDYRTIWRKLLADTILKLQSKRLQFIILAAHDYMPWRCRTCEKKDYNRLTGRGLFRGSLAR